MGIEALYSSILKIFSICCLFFSLSVYLPSFVIWIRYILSSIMKGLLKRVSQNLCMEQTELSKMIKMHQ